MNRSTFLVPILAIGAVTFAGCGHDDDNRQPAAAAPAFAFGDQPAAAFKRVDRMGMPVVATVVITSKDAYNAADPVNDAAGAFVGEITTNVNALHAALDDDLVAAGLTPTANGVAQAAPLVVPDVITIDTTKPAGFPNGRRLQDPVVDLTLAVVLLDLGTHAVDTLAKLPLNPPANDKAFLSEFPFLAAPHTP